MRYAFATILRASRFGWQSAPERPVRLRLYDQVRQMGFDGIEWSPRWLDFDGLSESELKSLKNEVLDHGLTVCAINLNRFILTRCEQATRHHERLVRSIDVAPNLGAEAVIISLSLPEPPTIDRPRLMGHTIADDEFDMTAQLLQDVADRADGAGIRFVLELHDDGLLDTAELCLRMRAAVDRPNVWINPDLGNLVRHAESIAAWRDAIELLAPHAGFWHIKNYRDTQPSPIWDGDIDYLVAFDAMERHDYTGWVSIESYDSDDVMSLQKKSMDWIRQRESRTVA